MIPTTETRALFVLSVDYCEIPKFGIAFPQHFSTHQGAMRHAESIMASVMVDHPEWVRGVCNSTMLSLRTDGQFVRSMLILKITETSLYD